MELRKVEIDSTPQANNITDARNARRCNPQHSNDTGDQSGLPSRKADDCTGSISCKNSCGASKHCPETASTPGIGCVAESLTSIEQEVVDPVHCVADSVCCVVKAKFFIRNQLEEAATGCLLKESGAQIQ